jgi:hypothetical protein
MIALLYGIAALGIGPMVLIDALTKHVRITDQGISIASSVFRPKRPWICWKSLTKVDVRKNPVRPSGIEKVILSERYKVGGYWKTRRLTIPGNQPDLPSILQIIREAVPDKFIG